MLEDAGGIRRVVLACGFVDLRKGIAAWPPSSGTGTGRTHLKRERCSSSAGNGWTGAKGCCGWAQVSSCSTSGLKTEDFPGPETARRLPSLRKNSTIT